MVALSRIQIGKQGLTEGFMVSLKNHFKNHTTIKITVLKSARDSGASGKAEV